jgi:hypothetical protein
MGKEEEERAKIMEEYSKGLDTNFRNSQVYLCSINSISVPSGSSIKAIVVVGLNWNGSSVIVIFSFRMSAMVLLMSSTSKPKWSNKHSSY